jgi:hypothetical protein
MAALATAASGQLELARKLARDAASVTPDDAWAQNVVLQLKAAR